MVLAPTLSPALRPRAEESRGDTGRPVRCNPLARKNTLEHPVMRIVVEGKGRPASHREIIKFWQRGRSRSKVMPRLNASALATNPGVGFDVGYLSLPDTSLGEGITGGLFVAIVVKPWVKAFGFDKSLLKRI